MHPAGVLVKHAPLSYYRTIKMIINTVKILPKKRQEEIKKIEQIYNSLDPSQQEEIRIETENRLPDF